MKHLTSMVGLENDPASGEVETPQHLICECVALTVKRYKHGSLKVNRKRGTINLKLQYNETCITPSGRKKGNIGCFWALFHQHHSARHFASKENVHALDDPHLNWSMTGCVSWCRVIPKKPQNHGGNQWILTSPKVLAGLRKKTVEWNAKQAEDVAKEATETSLLHLTTM